MPPESAYLWSAFLQMHRARGGNGYGPDPLGFAAINDWQRAMHCTLRPWEVEAIRAVDDVYLAVEAEKGEERPTKGAPP